jgi:regulator of RNase E activity RraA
MTETKLKLYGLARIPEDTPAMEEFGKQNNVDVSIATRLIDEIHVAVRDENLIQVDADGILVVEASHDTNNLASAIAFLKSREVAMYGVSNGLTPL